MDIVDMIKFAGVLLGAASVLVAPIVFYMKATTTKNEKTLEDSIQKLEKNQLSNNDWLRSELKEFRYNLDNRFSDVHTVVENKNKELKDFLHSEISFVRNTIQDVSFRVDGVKEKNHEIEKSLLRLQNEISREYISKDQLMHLQAKLNQN